MVLEITQETFNSAVKENIEDLGMEEKEAIEEAVKQFESQGVDLSNIVKEIFSPENHIKLVDELESLLEKKAGENELFALCKEIQDECNKSIQHRVSLGNARAYDVLLKLIDDNKEEPFYVKEGVLTMIALMTKQPDLLDERGVKLIATLMTAPNENRRLVMKWARECCLKHEMNRQGLMDSKIYSSIRAVLEDNNINLLRLALGLIRALVLDDDIRVEFGKAHEHARILASETLCPLINLLQMLLMDDTIVNDIVLTVSSLMVRSEYCKKFDEANGLKYIVLILNTHSKNEKIAKQVFKLLKALCGHDEIKKKIISIGLGPKICECLKEHKSHAQTTLAGLSCIAALSLRSPENSQALFDAGIPDVIVNVMQIHKTDKNVQKYAAWAIRNMVSRNRNLSKVFLAAGVEELLREDLKAFKEFEYDLKAALRDLGCPVELKEEWTGKGGALTTGNYSPDSPACNVKVRRD